MCKMFLRSNFYFSVSATEKGNGVRKRIKETYGQKFVRSSGTSFVAGVDETAREVTKC